MGDPEKELRDAFNFFDIDDSGSIGPDELKLLMLYLGQNVSENEIDAMMAIADEKGDVEISFEDFKVMWMNIISQKPRSYWICGMQMCRAHFFLPVKAVTKSDYKLVVKKIKISMLFLSRQQLFIVKFRRLM